MRRAASLGRRGARLRCRGDRIYCFAAFSSPDGTLDLLVNNVPSPNGLVLNGSEHILYVAATRGTCIWRVLMPDGTASKVGIFVQSWRPAKDTDAEPGR